MGKSELLVRGEQEKKKRTSISQSKSNELFHVKGLADKDTTKWILRDVPVDLDRLLEESKL